MDISKVKFYRDKARSYDLDLNGNLSGIATQIENYVASFGFGDPDDTSDFYTMNDTPFNKDSQFGAEKVAGFALACLDWIENYIWSHYNENLWDYSVGQKTYPEGRYHLNDDTADRKQASAEIQKQLGGKTLRDRYEDSSTPLETDDKRNGTSFSSAGINNPSLSYLRSSGLVNVWKDSYGNDIISAADLSNTLSYIRLLKSYSECVFRYT